MTHLYLGSAHRMAHDSYQRNEALSALIALAFSPITPLFSSISKRLKRFFLTLKSRKRANA